MTGNVTGNLTGEMTGGSRTVVVMGVSGTGKTTVGTLLATRTGWDFAEGDAFHSAANVAKMHAGHPLADDDRWPWLQAVAGWIGEHERAGRDAVITCSALRRSYRDVLRRGHPSVWFAQLVVPPTQLGERLVHRTGHFMPASLLESQLATLEPLQADEWGASFEATGDPAGVVTSILDRLG